MKSLQKATIAIVATFTLLFSVSAYAETHEDIADSAIVQMERMVDVALSVTDKASAEKAITEFKLIAEEMKKIAQAVKKLGQPSAELSKQIQTKFLKKSGELQKKMALLPAQIQKAGPEVAKVLMEGFAQINPVMEEALSAFKEADKK